jgi:hypothetical protein
MPFVLAALGIVFLVVSIQGTQGTLYGLLKSELTGKDSFIPWVLAIVLLGLAGYIKTIRPVTNALIGLVFLVMILVNGKGFFGALNKAIANPTAPAQASTSPPASPNIGAAPAGSSLAQSGNQINAGVPMVVAPDASGYELQPIPGL